MKAFLFVVCSLLVAASASPFRSYRERDWSKIKFKTPKIPPHTLKFVGQQEPAHAPKIPTETKNFREVCGINGKSAESRIVGGIEATPHTWPWQVGIFIDDMYFCGGQIISDEYIMTAAHCTDGAAFFDIILGAHYINDASAETEYSRVEVRTTTFTQHASYNSWFIINDISVIRLPAPITFTPEIAPVCLPTAEDAANTFEGELVTATGWGRPADSTNSISPVLRQVNIPVLANDACNAVYGIVTAGNICIDATDGKGTCNGDSGGPLVHKNADGSWKTLGITSFGSSAGCEVGYPDAFTRVSAFRDWIAENTGILY